MKLSSLNKKSPEDAKRLPDFLI